MMKIPETEAEIQKVDGVQQEERKIMEVSGHQRVVQADPAEVPVILPEKAVVAPAKRNRTTRNDDVDDQFDETDYEEFD